MENFDVPKDYNLLTSANYYVRHVFKQQPIAMTQGPSSQAGSFSAVCHSSNTTVNYQVLRIRSSHINQIHTLLILLLSDPFWYYNPAYTYIRKFSLPFTSLWQLLVRNNLITVRATCSFHLILINFMIVKERFGEMHILWRSSRAKFCDPLLFLTTKILFSAFCIQQYWLFSPLQKKKPHRKIKDTKS